MAGRAPHIDPDRDVSAGGISTGVSTLGLLNGASMRHARVWGGR